MQPRKLKVGIVRYPYGGNGASSSEHPDVGDWLVHTVLLAKSDPRIEDVVYGRLSDTPITMTRNATVSWARFNQVDVLVMVDSDMSPDLYVGKDQSAKMFFESSFNFLYDNYEAGPRIVVSPYCGPPAHPNEGGFENVYVFRWANHHTGHLPEPFKMEGYTRHEASVMTGISNIDAGPTGLSMYDMRVFDDLPVPYFDYEWEEEGPQCDSCHQTIPGPRMRKASTEDCFFFRNVALHFCETRGYNPVFCNWDAWSGHWKPWCVGKPKMLKSDEVGRHLKEAVLKGVKSGTRVMQVGKKSQADLRKEFEAQQPKLKDPEPDDLGHRTPDPVLETLQELVKAHLACTTKPMTIVELGTWVGKSAIAMAEACGTRSYVIHCYDLWDLGKGEDWATSHMLAAAPSSDGDPIYQQFRKNTADYENIIGHRSDTVEAGFDYTGKPIDFLWVDASHSYEAVKANIQAWLPHMADGGVIAGDDFNVACMGVEKAVRELFGNTVQTSGAVWCKVVSRETPSPARKWTLENVYGEGAFDNPHWGEDEPLTDAEVEEIDDDDATTRAASEEACCGATVCHDRGGCEGEQTSSTGRLDRSSLEEGLDGRVCGHFGDGDQEGSVSHYQAPVCPVLHRSDENPSEDDRRLDAGRNHTDGG